VLKGDTVIVRRAAEILFSGHPKPSFLPTDCAVMALPERHWLLPTLLLARVLGGYVQVQRSWAETGSPPSIDRSPLLEAPL